MSTKKAAGSAKNLNTSNPKFLGTKLYAGQSAQPGSIIIRQRGSKIIAGTNVGTGVDYTLFSLTTGKIRFSNLRKTHFDGSKKMKKVVHVDTAE